MAELPGLYEQVGPEMERVALEQFLESYRVDVLATVSSLTDEVPVARAWRAVERRTPSIYARAL